MHNEGITIIRNFVEVCVADKHEHHDAIPDFTLRANRMLSMQAGELYSFLGTCREDWTIERGDLISLLAITRDQYNTYCLELEDGGYLYYCEGEALFFADGWRGVLEWERLKKK